MEKLNNKTKTSSRVLGTSVDKRGNACVVPSSTKAGSVQAVSVGGKIARHSRGAGVSWHSRIPKLRNVGALGRRLVGSFPPSSSPDVLDISPPVSGASDVLARRTVQLPPANHNALHLQD